MEEGFLIAKELNQPWAEVQEMDSRDRAWLVDRLHSYYKEQNAEAERERKGAKSGSGTTRNILDLTDDGV